ncbi:MAG: serine hydrolase [Candidatus Andeanibacterium colombiense]|uniref:Serine hydrolase n=1 Tax=Candidatus Andeanibacterium colombiense TaxID=3121345 RepID=A0AAJ5X4B1_9SPHN|nr:MAG: serine hydrolase [Sphingomonadaceae bacterium]
MNALHSLPLSRRNLIRSAAALAGAAAFPLPLWAQEPERWPNLRKLCQDYVGRNKVANMVAFMGLGDRTPAVVAEGRDTMGGARKSDGDSLYRLYSMTKPITGMAAMILVDEGKLSLDQPLAEILPAFAKMQVQKKYDGSIGPENLEPAARPILIRNLLTHTAGLSYGIIQSGPIAKRATEIGVVSGQVSRVPVPGFERGTPVGSLAEFADRLATLPLVYQPGTRWSYSTGLDLMGRVIEVVSGQSFGGFLQDRILGPCGMASTGFQVAPADAARLTTNYGVVDGMLLPIDPAQSSIYLDRPPFPFGGAGLVGSPRDYDRFLTMIGNYGMLDGKRVMSESAVRLGTSNLLPEGASTKGTAVEGYGFGAGGRQGGPHGNNYGWAGAAGTIGFVSMASGLRSGLYTQYMPSGAYPLNRAFEEAVLADVRQLLRAGA